jgi:hypothetical protein
MPSDILTLAGNQSQSPALHDVQKKNEFVRAKPEEPEFKNCTFKCPECGYTATEGSRLGAESEY